MDATTPRYECIRCGNCCRWAGWVYLTDAECDAIAAFMGMPPRDFTAKYTRLAPDRQRLGLVEKKDDACIFLSGQNHCQINAVKPRQCREFPNGWSFPGFERSCRALIRG